MVNECPLPYGESYLSVRLPDGIRATFLNSKHIPGLQNPVEAITNSLRAPTGCPPLNECLKRNDKVVILVTDNTRACPDDKLLPPILAEIETKVPRENITIMVALGLHKPLNKEELCKKLGRQIVHQYNVENHDISQTIKIGETSRGIPVEVNRKVVEADFRISTGFIEPHFFAGFSGSCKSIFPGVSSSRAIHLNHGFQMINHPNARAGILKGNPIHEDIVEHARITGLNFIVNVLLNKKREITHVFAGDCVEAHEKGCETEQEIARVKVDHKFDIIITTNSGAPLDLDFYQTCKGIENASSIIREGGIIIIASSCSMGVGPGTFRKLHASESTPQAVLEKIENGNLTGVQWQNQILARIQVNNTVYLVSGLEDSLAREMMVVPFPTLEAALQGALEVMGNNAEIAVIPEGPLVLPQLEGE